MPFRCKCTFIFEGPQKGWTESLYLEPLTQTFAEASTLTQNLCVARAKLLGRESAIKAYRVQVVQDAGGLPVKRRGDTIQRPFFGYEGQPGADADLALLCDFLDATATRHKSMFMRGIWDIISQNYGAYTPDPQFELFFTTWREQLISSGFSWLARNQLATSNVVGYEQTETGFVEITVSDPIFTGLPTLQPIQVQVQGVIGQGGLSNLNGTLLVKPLTATTCQTVKQRAVLPFLDGGKLSTFGYVMVKTAQVSPEKIVSHETGSPLLESPGRSKARSRV